MSSYFRNERIAWIREIVRVYGFINREHVERKFGISTPQASLDLRSAQGQDQQIIYDPSAKRYIFRGP